MSCMYDGWEAGDVIVLVLNPLRLVITKDYTLAFDTDDPTVNHWMTQLAATTKRQYRDKVVKVKLIK